MKPMRSMESARLRRDLAQLLRRLRTIRQAKLSHDELAQRVNVAMTEAGDVSRFVAFRNSDEGGDRSCRGGLAYVDKSKLHAEPAEPDSRSMRDARAVAAGRL